MWLPLVLCAAGLAPAPGLPGQQPAQRTSLEEYLRAARIERAELHRRLGAQAGEHLGRLGRLPEDASAAALESAISGLASLGVDATPLLVRHLEVTPTPGGSEEERAQRQATAERLADRVAEALHRMPCDPIRPELLELAEHGSHTARLRALRVLENSNTPEPVRSRLRALLATAGGELAEALLKTLIAVGGEGQQALLVEQLLRTDVSRAELAPLVELALGALASSGPDTQESSESSGATAAVRALLANPEAADLHGEALLAYFLAQPDLVRSEEVLQFVRIATGSAPRTTRLAVLAALPELDPPLNHDLRSGLAPLLTERDSALREAALVALATLGDRSSKKDLLAGYNESVERNDHWYRGYSERGWVLLRIGENDDAIRDFRRALEYGKDSATLQPTTYIGLARACARKGKLKDAAEWLRKAPISLADLQALEGDRDFRALRASRWGKEAFGR